MNFDRLTDHQILDEIAQRVKQHRLNLNITQKELAVRSGVHVQTIKKIESGKSVNLRVLIQILRAFGELNAFGNFLPKQGVSPIQLLKLKGKERERASKNKSNEQTDSEW